MKTLVIGAGGFVGGHLIREFESAGHEVVVSDVESALPSLCEGSRRTLAIDILEPRMGSAPRCPELRGPLVGGSRRDDPSQYPGIG
jgi:nucleoside-diphosphate-sugar epimerase